MKFSIDNPIETMVGAGVLAVAIGFGVYATQVSVADAVSGSYPVHALFRSATGISIGADVRVAGVKVGSVSGLGLDPKTFRARVTMSIRDDVKLTDDTMAKVDSEGLLGGSYVALEPGSGLDTLGPDGEITFTQGALSLTDLIVKLGGGDKAGAAPGGDK